MALLQFKAPVDYEKHQGMVISNYGLCNYNVVGLVCLFTDPFRCFRGFPSDL